MKKQLDNQSSIVWLSMYKINLPIWIQVFDVVIYILLHADPLEKSWIFS